MVVIMRLETFLFKTIKSYKKEYTDVHMKKTFSLALFFLLFAFLTPVAHAQMMMKSVTTSATPSASQKQTQEDEAAGKVIWEKLNDKKVTCSELKDDDYDVLGDFFMGSMAGTNHDEMNQMMTQRLGADGQKQMHIALAKRQSGCDINAVYPQGASYFSPMMGSGGGMMNQNSNAMIKNTFGIFKIFGGIAVMTFLILGSAFFWKELRKTT